MNKLFRRTLNVLAIVMLTFAMNIVVFAQGTTMIAVSKNSPAVGDKVTVSVTASESGTITLKYTASMLTFVSCTGSGYTTSGNSVSFSGKSGDVVFTTAEAGTASIIVSSTSCSGSSTTLSIGGSAPAETAPAEKPAEPAPVEIEAEEPAAEEAPAEEAPAEAPSQGAAGNVGTLNSQGGFDINGVSYVVSERYSDNEVPSGFSKTTVKIGSSTYSEPTNGTITLLYLKPADNVAGSGVFYLYNAEASTVSEFLMLGSGKNFVIISPAEAGPSPAFAPTSLDVTGGSTTAYTIGESGFYYVYGTNGAGDTGWFVFDSANDTVSRMDESLLSATSTVEEDIEEAPAPVNDNVDVYISKLDTYRKVIMGLIILCVILVFFIINTLVRSRDKDDFDGDVFAEPSVRKPRKGPRSIVLNRPNREEEDDYDEEEEYEDAEEDEYYDDEYYDEEEQDEDEYEEEYDDRRSSSYVESASEIDNRRNSSLNMMDLNDL